MTPTQKIQLRMSEKREELRNLGMFTDLLEARQTPQAL